MDRAWRAVKKPKNGAVCKEERLCVDNLTRWKIRYKIKMKGIRARQLEIAAAQEALRGKYPGGVLKREGESSDLGCMGKRTCDGWNVYAFFERSNAGEGPRKSLVPLWQHRVYLNRAENLKSAPRRNSSWYGIIITVFICKPA